MSLRSKVITRIQGTVFNFPGNKILVINCYFPCDPRNENFDDSELLEVLAEVEYIMDNTIFDDILWQGDLNWDMSRNSEFGVVMRRFMNKVGLISVWERHHPMEFYE